MKRTSIAYTDSISGLASLSYLVATPGETKTMTAEYTLGGTCITLDNTVRSPPIVGMIKVRSEQ